MKKFLTFILLFVTFISFSQETEKYEKSHELKINALSLIFFKSIDVSYEYLLDEESSIGISFLVNLNDEYNDGPNYNETIAITPYYRHFFSKRYAWGFFVEGFGMYNAQKIEDYDYDSIIGGSTYLDKRTSNFALGVTLGGKFVSEKGFIFEFFGGIGRNLFTSDSRYNSEIVPRIGTSFGYRF
ncbi:MAG: DUF3575 domain-containing protein [Flavobacteriaceae bacterium]|nr:DUF3575 domain-containing protein [Flavobacteriaceae bacterium]